MADHKRRRVWPIILGVLVAAVVVLVAVWDWDWFRPLVEARASAALGRKVTMTHFGLRLGWHPVAIADGVTVANPDGFPGGAVLRPHRPAGDHRRCPRLAARPPHRAHPHRGAAPRRQRHPARRRPRHLGSARARRRWRRRADRRSRHHRRPRPMSSTRRCAPISRSPSTPTRRPAASPRNHGGCRRHLCETEDHRPRRRRRAAVAAR